MSKIHHKQDGTGRGRELRALGVVQDRKKSRFSGWQAEAACEEKKGAKSGETGTETSGEKDPNDSCEMEHKSYSLGAEEMEKTMKKDRAYVLDMDGPVPNNEEGDGDWKEQCEVGVSG